MSNLYARKLSLSGINLSNRSVDEMRQLVKELLDNKIHGLSFSPYVEGQGPGTILEAPQIRQRMDIIKPHVNWIRSFSCTDGNELIPGIAQENNLKTMVGVWLDDDLEHNEKEVTNAIAVAKAEQATIFAVGNEVLLRDELTEDQLIGYMNRIKQAAPGVPVGYVDAYFKFEDYPRVTEACDVILANCYPFWEGCPADFALLYMKDMYRRAQRVANGKKIIVTETGWPNTGTPTDGAIPSFENAIKYFVDTYQWAEEDDIDVFYFSSFDESWKVDAEGDVGAYWGLWDKDGKPKYS
ncbi:MAG: glycosyl hydrolase family 17 protein [Gammaproteobacteria bacterium]